MDCSPPGSSVHGILQARILEWVAVPSPGDLPDSGIKAVSLISPALEGEFFTTSTTWEAHIYKCVYLCVCVCVCVCVYTFIECNLIDTKHQLISGYTYLHIVLITLNALFGLICNLSMFLPFPPVLK